MNPFFTVVVASLNQGAFLDQALHSLLQQNASDLEIIVVDGGSTDGSVAIVEKYAALLNGQRFGEGGEVLKFESSKVLKCVEEQQQLAVGSFLCQSYGGQHGDQGSSWQLNERVKDNFRTLELSNFRTRFLWCSEPDRGQSHAFNKGFARANGRFLFWLNADDVLLPGTLDCVRTYLTEHVSAEWFAGNMIYIDSQSRIISCLRGERWHDGLYQNAPVHVYGPSAFFSRELYGRVGAFNEALRYCMDVDLWQRFRAAGARIERLDHYFWGFRRHGGSKTKGGDRDKEHIRAEEIRAMYVRHGLKITWPGLALQRCWRLLSGCYLLSLWDTLRLRRKVVCSEPTTCP